MWIAYRFHSPLWSVINLTMVKEVKKRAIRSWLVYYGVLTTPLLLVYGVKPMKSCIRRSKLSDPSHNKCNYARWAVYNQLMISPKQGTIIQQSFTSGCFDSRSDRQSQTDLVCECRMSVLGSPRRLHVQKSKSPMH